MARLQLLVVILLLFFSERIKASEVIVVGVEESIPWNLDCGLSTLNHFAADNGLQVEYRILPVERLFKELNSGKIDFKYPDNPAWKKEQREVRPRFSKKPLFVVTEGFIRRKSEKSQIHKVGTILGFTTPHTEKYEMSFVRDYKSLLQLLISKRVDAVYGNIEILNQAREGRGADFEYSKLAPFSNGDYYLSSVASGKFISEFDRWREKQIRRLKLKDQN